MVTISHAADPPLPASDRTRGRRLVRAAVFGLGAAAAVLAGRLTGLLVGAPGLLLAMVVLLLLPTSREFSRRLFTIGCLLAGWTQVAWWTELPLGGVGRVTAALAVVAGALGAWVGAAARPARRALTLVPRFRIVDAYPPLVVGVGVVALAPWLQRKTASESLGLLMGAWDNVAHFSMVTMASAFGATVDALAPPAFGGTWQFASYPQGYHAVVATIVELLRGPGGGDLGDDLLTFTQASALLAVASAAMLVAGFCALPALRRRPLLAAPLVTFVAAVLLLGPGSAAIHAGFGNFGFACVLVVAAALAATVVVRVPTPLPLAVLGGALVGVAAGWALLVVLVVPAVVAVLFPLRRSRWSASPLRWAVSALVVAAVVGCLLRTVVVLSRLGVGNPLVIPGGFLPVDYWLAAAATVAAGALCLLVGRRVVPTIRLHPVRVAVLAAVPVVGAVTTLVLVVMQLVESGEVSYYAQKFMTAVEVVTLCLVAIPLAHLARRRGGAAAGGWRRLPALVASVVAVLVASQVFGWTFAAVPPPGRDGTVQTAAARGLVDRAADLRRISNPSPTADLADRVAAAPAGLPVPLVYLDVSPDRPLDPILSAQWYFALTDTWTLEANALADLVRPADRSDEEWARVAEVVLSTRPDVYLAVRPQVVRDLDRLLPPELTRRVLVL